MYDKSEFDIIYERRKTHCVKWDGTKERFGKADLLPFWIADMDFQAPKEVLNALHNRIDHGIFGYPQWHNEVKEAVAQWEKKRHAWEISPEWISPSPGVVPGLAFAILANTELQDRVLIQPPVYYPFAQIIKGQKREVASNPLAFDGERYCMDFDDLEKHFSNGVEIMILCSPHNPVGRVWTSKELERIAELCCRYDILVLSDEIHQDIVYASHQHIPFASLGKELEDRTITFISPSKTFNLAGLYTSAVIIPNPELKKRFDDKVASFDIDCNQLGITAMEAAYRNGEEWLDSLIQYLEENLAFVKDFLRKYLPKVKLVEPEGTYLLWLDFREMGLESQGLFRLLVEDAKVALNDGAAFGEGGNGFARMNIACPRKLLEEGLTRIQRAVNHFSIA